MKIFLDTSSLFKLYHEEAGSEVVESVFSKYTVTEIFLSELCKIEFASTVWKKVRIKEINELQAKSIMQAFEDDYGKFSFVQLDVIIMEQAKELIAKYGNQGLRSLDSIQLSTAVLLKGKAALFISSDKLLVRFLEQESLLREHPGI